jgi:hypothetical protein
MASILPYFCDKNKDTPEGNFLVIKSSAALTARVSYINKVSNTCHSITFFHNISKTKTQQNNPITAQTSHKTNTNHQKTQNLTKL